MKKRLLAFIVLVSVLCMTFPAFADGITEKITGSCGENLTYEYDPSLKTLTISGTGKMTDYSLSAGEEHVPWESLKNGIETVNIENGVTSIGSYTFYACRNLKSITIPDSVTGIGEEAFESTAYYEDDSKWENGVLYIGNHLIKAENDELKQAGISNYTVNSGTKTIADSAFSSCGVTSITVPDSVTSIGRFAFYFCDELVNITLPDSVTSIGDNAFYATYLYNEWYGNSEQCNVLYIGHHLIKADEWALNQAISKNNISSDYVVKSVTKTIADNAFEGCESLTGITLPDSVASIGNCAFEKCSSLTDITIPKSVRSIGDYVFQTCVDLTDISVDPANTAYCDEDGVLYNKEKTKIMRFPTKNKKWKTSFIIPNSVTSIADGAFERCWNLTDIAIPDSVKSIGNSAFESCEKLTSITIPDSVTGIGDSALLGCSSLIKVIIPDGVTEIGYRTFYNCSDLTSVTIPNSVQIVDKEAFEKCTNLKTVNYIGSEADWENVTGSGKNNLKNVNHLSGISAKRSEDRKIVVKPINIENGKNVILALYDGDKLVEMQQSSDYGEDNREITFTTTKDYTRARVMVWESLSKMTPVCGIKTLRIN